MSSQERICEQQWRSDTTDAGWSHDDMVNVVLHTLILFFFLAVVNKYLFKISTNSREYVIFVNFNTWSQELLFESVSQKWMVVWMAYIFSGPIVCIFFINILQLVEVELNWHPGQEDVGHDTFHFADSLSVTRISVQSGSPWFAKAFQPLIT